MFSNQTAQVNLKGPIRALSALKGDQVNSKFIVAPGGGGGGGGSYLQLLQFHSDSNVLVKDAALECCGGTNTVSKICTSPWDPQALVTIAQNNNDNNNNTTTTTTTTTTLYQIPQEALQQGKSNFDMDDDDDDHDDGRNDDDDEDEDDVPSNLVPMKALATLESPNHSPMVDVQWRGPNHSGGEDNIGGGSDNPNNVLTLDASGQLQQWDFSAGEADMSRTVNVMSNKSPGDGSMISSWHLPPKMAWDPHQVNQTAVACGTNLYLVDWRSSNETTTTQFPCHRYGVTDLDYNPNKPHVLTTCGRDGLLQFWDLRYYKQPLLTTRGGHSHWVTNVSYNPFHDQLVLSAGTDSIVNLWRVSTISSAPLLTLDDDDDHENSHLLNLSSPTKHNNNHSSPQKNNQNQQEKSETSGPNVRVSRYEHMDAVYATAWGAADAWIYASAGYDGKVVLNHVPSKEKYKILL